jgi:predicted hydrocarbon binding protein
MLLELARTPESNRERLARTLRNPQVADDRIRDYVRIITGPQPYRHAHYSADQFFETNPAAGTVHTIYGQRTLRASDAFLQALSHSLAEHAPERVGEILYRMGRTWGESLMSEFALRIEQEYEVEFEKLGVGMVLESWWWSLRAMGWGACDFDFSRARKGVVAVRLHDSAAVVKDARPQALTCHLYAGLFAAAFGALAHREVSCAEIGCAAKGDEHCTFVVAAETRAKAAAGQRDAGARADEILERIAN